MSVEYKPASVFTHLTADLDRLKSGEADSLVFPSRHLPQTLEGALFECRIGRDPASATRWTMLFRCARPQWWSRESPPSPRRDERERFATLIGVRLALDPEELDSLRSDVATFLLWLDREARHLSAGDL